MVYSYGEKEKYISENEDDIDSISNLKGAPL